MVIVNKTSPNCSSTASQLSTDKLPTDYQQRSNRPPTILRNKKTPCTVVVSILSTVCGKNMLQPVENPFDMIGFQNQWQQQISCAACHTCQVIVSMKKLSLNASCLLGHHVDYQPRKDLGLLLTDRIHPKLRCVYY